MLHKNDTAGSSKAFSLAKTRVTRSKAGLRRTAKAAIETLESRTLLSVSLTATRSHASALDGAKGHGLFTVSRTDSTAQALAVEYTVDPSSTAVSSQYAPLSGEVVIPAGKKSATIDVTPVDDGIVRPTEALKLTLEASTDYQVNAKRASATVLIADPHSTVSIAATKPKASEKLPTTKGQGQFTVTRTGKPVGSLLVNYSLDPSSTAISGVDFNSRINGTSGIVVIPNGKSSAVIDITPIGDQLLEPTRTLTLDLSGGSYKLGKKAKATLTIADDGTSKTPRGPIVDIAATSDGSELNTALHGQLLVTRKGSLATALTVPYSVSGTAVAGTDYKALGGSVVIPAGQSSAAIDIAPLGSSTPAPTTVIVTLSDSGESNSSSKTATVTLAANPVVTPVGPGPVVPAGWLDTAFHQRLPITVNSGSTARANEPIDYAVNFTEQLSALGRSGALNEASIRVVETNADGSQVIDANVPFQFDKAPTFDATTNASGDLVIVLTGNTPASTARHYHVYYDTGSGFTAPTVTPLVTTTDNVTDAGQAAVEIDTQTAKYFLQKANGGFSSIIDNNGNDWLNFDPTPGSGSAGEFRGLPNAVFGGGFHAGFTTGSTQIVSTGPLKTTLITTLQVNTTGAGLSTYKMEYEIYPTFVRATMLQADAQYWFLYEGTPGGTINDNDYVVRSDGTNTNINTTFNVPNGIGASNGQDWLYFESAAENRYLYMVDNQPDNQVDSYFLMEHSMTVFGFGRDNSQTNNDRERLTGTASFTFGLADGGSDFAAASTQINGTYQALTSTGGSGQAI